MTDLRERLADLATEAPGGETPPRALWSDGVQHHRRRRTATVGVVLAFVALVAGGGLMIRQSATSAPAVRPTAPPADLHLPRTVYRPSPWAAGTDRTGAPGPLAVVGIASRKQASGWGAVHTSGAPYGISAATGAAIFLDLRDTRAELLGEDTIALSPDGTKVGYLRYASMTKIVGFAVYDTVTGRTTVLRDPRTSVIRAMRGGGLEFSGDSRYLEVSYSRTGTEGAKQHALVAWDVATGKPIQAERAGYYWLPDLGSGPSGVVWSRGHDTITFDPVTGARSSVATSFEVLQPSYGPDGRTLAAIANGAKKQDRWRLFGGPDDRHLHQLALRFEPDDIQGWRDDQHVVVRDLPSGSVYSVDVRSGRATQLVRAGADHAVVPALYAADLWSHPMTAGVRPPVVGDPRRPWGMFAGAGVVAILGLGAAGTWWRRRVRL